MRERGLHCECTREVTADRARQTAAPALYSSKDAMRRLPPHASRHAAHQARFRGKAGREYGIVL